MVCYAPLTGYYSRSVGASGKRGITFQRSASLSGEAIRLPCGQCVGCRLEKSRQWAMRCMHERRLHKDNVFVTLTYDNDHLPPGGTLVKRDLQLFMKRLRKLKAPQKVRFYGCGEYGDVNKRPHYHVILFGCVFSDARSYGANRRNEKYFTSKELGSIWTFGNHILGDVTFESCAYVARYLMKKVTGDAARCHYEVVTRDGEIIERVPEFTVMSRRPGIGLGWYSRYGKETYALDSVLVNGRPVRPPRYYDSKFDLEDPVAMARLKRKRKWKALMFKSDNTVDRRRVKEQLAVLRLRELRRRI